jgi:hypothetical protein
MIYVRPFKISDFKAFVPIEPFAGPEPVDPEFAQAIEDSGLAVTGIMDGKVIGCGGVHPVNDFHGELWLRLSTDCLKYKYSFARWLKEGLRIIEEDYPFKQLNATIKCCFETSIKMIEHLGFERTQEVEREGQKWFVYSKRVK